MMYEATIILLILPFQLSSYDSIRFISESPFIWRHSSFNPHQFFTPIENAILYPSSIYLLYNNVMNLERNSNPQCQLLKRYFKF